jgi:hypothetical protein
VRHLAGEVVELAATHLGRALQAVLDEATLDAPGDEVVVGVDTPQEQGGRLFDGRRP